MTTRGDLHEGRLPRFATAEYRMRHSGSDGQNDDDGTNRVDHRRMTIRIAAHGPDLGREGASASLGKHSGVIVLHRRQQRNNSRRAQCGQKKGQRDAPEKPGMAMRQDQVPLPPIRRVVVAAGP